MKTRMFVIACVLMLALATGAQAGLVPEVGFLPTAQPVSGSTPGAAEQQCGTPGTQDLSAVQGGECLVDQAPSPDPIPPVGGGTDPNNGGGTIGLRHEWKEGRGQGPALHSAAGPAS